MFRKLLGEKNGATASAMVLGRKKGMDSEVKALYQGAGISHLLAISGLHLSMIGAGLFGLLKKVRLPVALSAGISTWILIVYAQLTGMGISTRRALVMFLLFLAAGLLKRTPDLPTSLAVAALLLLVPKPQRILDAGFQLFGSARDCRDDSGFAGWLEDAALRCESPMELPGEYCPATSSAPSPPQKYPCRSGWP
ncbi:MAG: ComEC/Rec2 family competence protein [Gallintestinimicrobium sp.]